jgi:hypothetical protein
MNHVESIGGSQAVTKHRPPRGGKPQCHPYRGFHNRPLEQEQSAPLRTRRLAQEEQHLMELDFRIDVTNQGASNHAK